MGKRQRKKRNGKRYVLEDGIVAFRWLVDDDPRTYVPPKGFVAECGLVEEHPATGKPLGENEWWVFLAPIGEGPGA